MLSFENFKDRHIDVISDQINFWSHVPFPDGMRTPFRYFLFDNDNDIISFSGVSLSVDVNDLYKNKNADDIHLVIKEIDTYISSRQLKDIDYNLELDFYWYLQKKYNANYLSICELEKIGERYYLTSKFLNLMDMTSYKDIVEAARSAKGGLFSFREITLAEEKSRIIDNMPGILDLFSSRINCNWNEQDLKIIDDLYIKHRNHLLIRTFNPSAPKENDFFTALDSKLKIKIASELILLNGKKITSETQINDSPEFKIVSIVDSIRLLQSKGLPLFRCIAETDNQLPWLTSIEGDSVLRKQFEDFINRAKGSVQEANSCVFDYIRFRVKLDFPDMLSEEQIDINNQYTIEILRSQNLMQ